MEDGIKIEVTDGRRVCRMYSYS